MNSHIVTLFILIGILGFAHAAIEEYPRPWQNETWLEENPYFGDTGEELISSIRTAVEVSYSNPAELTRSRCKHDCDRDCDDEDEDEEERCEEKEDACKEKCDDYFDLKEELEGVKRNLQVSLNEMELEALGNEAIERKRVDLELLYALQYYGYAQNIDLNNELNMLIASWDMCSEWGADVGGAVGDAVGEPVGAEVGAVAGGFVVGAATEGVGVPVGALAGGALGGAVGGAVGEPLGKISGGGIMGSACLNNEVKVAVVSEAWDIWHYPKNWKTCSNSALVSLEEKGEYINLLNGSFEFWRNEFEEGGICDYEYVGLGLEYCEMPAPNVECNYSAIGDEIPGFAWYPTCVREHWNAIAELEGKVYMISTTYSELVITCEEDKAEAADRKAEAGQKFSEIESEELEKIYPSGGGADSSGAEGVRGRYAELQEAKELGDSSAITAIGAEYGIDGWLKDCLEGSGTAIAAYDVIIQSDILDESEGVVEKRGEEAKERLSEAEEKSGVGGEGKRALEIAQDACDDGDYGTLGYRFEKYSKCLEYANNALDSFEKVEMGILVEEDELDTAELEAALAELKIFLDSADVDGIDTQNEWALYDKLGQEQILQWKDIIDNVKEGVLNKAEEKYSGLPQRRNNLKELVALGGVQFAYLNSWFDVGEECYSKNELNYACALGRLQEMSESYDAIEAQLWEERVVLVGDSVIVDTWLSWSIPTLDEQSESYLYVSITNPTEFDAEAFMVEVPADLEFRKIDLVSGSESVRMVTPKKGKLEIYLTGINASETLDLVFKKMEIVCRTQDYEVVAYGDSEGGALVTETLDIDCGYGVGGLILGDAWNAESITIDGLGATLGDEGIERELSAGKHTLVIESYDYGAYEVEREPSFVSTIGQTTKVELFFNFKPARDLEYIAYSSVEEGKDLGKLDIFGYTGESITDKKVMGESTIFFKIKKLVEGKEAKVRVTYEISDLEEYVNQEIIYYSAQNLTVQEEGILNEAKNYLLADEEIEAYKKIEELRSSMEKRAKKYSSVLGKHEKLKEKIEVKISSLESAIALAAQMGIENSYVLEMGARVSELKNALLLELDEDSLISPLENIDLGWEKKELTKISKELLSSEKDLKEGWAETDIDDAGMAAAIEEVEAKNSRFSGTLNFDDAILAFNALGQGEEILEGLEENKVNQDLSEGLVLDGKIQEADEVLVQYNKEYEEADGTHLEGLFPIKPSAATKELKALSKRTDYSGAIEETDELIEKMQGTLALLKEEEKLLEESVEILYYELKDNMGELDSEFINAAIQNAKGYAAKGNYVQGIQSLEAALLRMDSLEESDSGIIILAVTGLLVLGIISLYLLREQIPRDILPFHKKEERQYKKLKRKI